MSVNPDRRKSYAPGMIVVIRVETWRVRRIDTTSTNKDALHVVGISELVRDREAIFSTEFDSVKVLDPRETRLVVDDSSYYHKSLLYMESMLRRIPPVDERLHVGHKAAMDVMDFQLEPAAMALSQPRQRLLIADAVGLGKTLEAGILLSELIARGRARRILVVATKSMLTQFQKELWARFTIPLVRLDSVGLQRIRHRIPTNHNPFYYFDRSIISIDTLKQNNEYRRYLEESRWDVIIIDEAHNVARRGASKHSRAGSLRNRLAELLATRSDTLIMLSATPHDGKAQSFASLMNMLDPTAIADEENYTAAQIKRLYIRRFKKDVSEQLGEHLPERVITQLHAQASPQEEACFDLFSQLQLDEGGARSSGQMLFKTTLEKALLSSPMACLETVDKRVRELERRADPASRHAQDIASLGALSQALGAIQAPEFSKYQRLLSALKDSAALGWKPKADDRLIIFTERIKTMSWLHDQLAQDLGLEPGVAIRVLHGGMNDLEQLEVVEEFGKERAKLRVLVASDVASEGINLHYFAHRLIHFDIPWSLMVFQQRNGRIDRYGQSKQPQIVYLLTQAQNARFQGDQRILEILIRKDEQVQRNIGDPSALTHAYTPEEEEVLTAKAIEAQDLVGFERGFTASEDDFDLFALDLDAEVSASLTSQIADAPPSLYESELAYLQAAFESMEDYDKLKPEFDLTKQRVELQLTTRLKRRLKHLPQELEFTNDRLILTADVDAMKRAMEEARRAESTWPEAQYLWRLHPIFSWVEDCMMAAFGRHSAPVICLDEGLAPNEQVIVLSGLLPNRKSQPVIHRWFAVSFIGQRLTSVTSFEALQARLRLGARPLPNRPQAPDVRATVQRLLPLAVVKIEDQMIALRQAYNAQALPRVQEHVKELEQLREAQLEVQLKLLDDGSSLDAKRRRIDNIFNEYTQWIRDTLETEPVPFIQVIAAFVASS